MSFGWVAFNVIMLILTGGFWLFVLVVWALIKFIKK